jgi:hypothetical protein
MTKRGCVEKWGWTMEVSGNERGVTLVETMIAVLVAMVGVFGLGSLIFQATVTNKNQGTEVTRATIYAQDKAEKLLSMGSAGAINTTSANFLTCNQGVASNPAPCNSSGIVLAAWRTGLVAGGLTTPMQTSCPTTGLAVGYVDFLDINGNKLTGADCSAIPAASIAYVRMWQIVNLASTGGPTIKRVTVAVFSQAAIATTGGVSSKPVVMLTSYMSNPNSCSAAEAAAGCQM